MNPQHSPTSTIQPAHSPLGTRRWTALATLALSLALSLAMVGCSVLEPRPDSTRYFRLDARAAASDAPRTDLILGLGPIEVPEWLDRAEMPVFLGPNEVRYAAGSRWIEPLGGQVDEVLRANLDRLLRPAAIEAYPWYASAGVDASVAVEIGAAGRSPDGAWSADLHWAVRDAEGEILGRGQTLLGLAGDGSEAGSLARTLSRDLLSASEQISAAVRGAPRGTSR